MKKDREKKMAMAPRSLFRRRALPPKKSKKDFKNPFEGFTSASSVALSTVEFSAILKVPFPLFSGNVFLN
jgi:hypothetical protein